MNRVLCLAFRVVIAAIVLLFGVSRMPAQAPAQRSCKHAGTAQEPGEGRRESAASRGGGRESICSGAGSGASRRA